MVVGIIVVLWIIPTVVSICRTRDGLGVSHVIRTAGNQQLHIWGACLILSYNTTEVINAYYSVTVRSYRTCYI
ncbi:hypothetical protein HBI79_138350 [Parastagonospora nodorum]|nr:hypothetical protein HBI79_138350 [Parastagonospora nodorum]